VPHFVHAGYIFQDPGPAQYGGWTFPIQCWDYAHSADGWRFNVGWPGCIYDPTILGYFRAESATGVVNSYAVGYGNGGAAPLYQYTASAGVLTVPQGTPVTLSWDMPPFITVGMRAHTDACCYDTIFTTRDLSVYSNQAANFPGFYVGYGAVVVTPPVGYSVYRVQAYIPGAPRNVFGDGYPAAQYYLDIPINVIPAVPTLSIYADANVVWPNSSVGIHWRTTNESNCTVYAGDAGAVFAQAVNGDQATWALQSDVTFTLACADGNTVSTRVYVQPIGSQGTPTCSVISGWACQNAIPSQPINVDMYLNGPAGVGTGYGRYPANQSRPDVSAAGYCNGNPNSGFSFPTPSILKDGAPHSIYLYAINGVGDPYNPVLFSSPQTVQCASAPPNPTITINGQSSITLHPGDAYDWEWNTPNPAGDNFGSVYTVNGVPMGGWIANTASGSATGIIDSSLLNKYYVISYAASNTAGSNTATGAVYICPAGQTGSGGVCVPNTVSITADSATVVRNRTTGIHWRTTNETACTVYANYAVFATGVSGDQMSPALPSDTTFTLSCADGLNTNTVVRVVDPAVSIYADSATVTRNGTTGIHWRTTGETACTVYANAAVFATGLSGDQMSPALPSDTTFTLSCADGLNANTVVTVQVILVGSISQFSASPSRVRAGETTNLTWSTTNMSTCRVTNSAGTLVSSLLNSSGFPQTLTHSEVYTLTCVDGAGRTTTAKATAGLIPHIQEI
jgi:hypothetical protein